MPEVILSDDCGNSPKNQFVEQVTVALLLRDAAVLERSLSDDAVWELPGSGVSLGKPALLAGQHLPADDPIAKLTIIHVLTHGKVGAVNGEAVFESGRVWPFCTLFVFANAKANSIRSVSMYMNGRGA
jgi:hypothetical protein